MTHMEQVRPHLIGQLDPRWPWWFNRYGCRWRSLAAIPEIVAGTTLTFTQLSELLEITRQNPRAVTVNEDGGPYVLCGPDEHEIADGAAVLLGSPYRYRQVGVIDAHGTPTMWAADLWEYQIIHWSTAGADGHYTVADRRGEELWDPWDNGRLEPELLESMGLWIGFQLEKPAVRRRLLYRVRRIL